MNALVLAVLPWWLLIVFVVWLLACLCGWALVAAGQRASEEEARLLRGGDWETMP